MQIPKIIFRGDFAAFEPLLLKKGSTLTVAKDVVLPSYKNGVLQAYYIRFGGVRCNLTNEQGTERTLLFLSDHTIFPLTCLSPSFSLEPYLQYVCSRDEGALIHAFPASELSALMAASGDFARAVAAHLFTVTELLLARSLLDSYQDSRLQVCILLYIWLAQTRLGNHREIYQSQEEIAQWCGVSRVHLTRVLAELREAGAISTSHRCLAVVSPQKLLDFCSAQGLNDALGLRQSL